MKGIFSAVSSVLLGIAILLGITLLAMFFIEGGFKVANRIYPIVEDASSIALAICIFVFLPSALFRNSRGFAGLGLYIASYVFGISLWIGSFAVTYWLWGGLGVFIGLFLAGVGVVPTALLATAFNGRWDVFLQVVLGIVYTFGSRLLGTYLAERHDRESLPLPETIDCPFCSASMSLDEEERRSKRFNCPGCGGRIDLRGSESF